jgi:hypothetical protein
MQFEAGVVSPNFIICGAAKAGTTSLYQFLRNSPEIFMPRIKEPHFLVRKSISGRVSTLIESPEEYLGLFYGSDSYLWRGEASVFYLYYHEEAINNIVEFLGLDTKIIILLRNPIDRAYSAYLHAAKYNPQENLSFIEALQSEEQRMQDPACSPMLFYKTAGLYSRMVRAYLDVFPSVKVFFFDDLIQDSMRFSHDLYEFLGLQMPDVRSFNEHQNVGGREWSNKFLGGAVKMLGTRSVRRVARLAAPKAYESFKASLARNMMRSVAPMDDSMRAYLEDFFHDDIISLSGLLGRDLTHWVS